MKFKIDQNLPIEFTVILQQAGHNALTVFEQQLGGAPDPQIVAACQREDRILITAAWTFRTFASTRQSSIPALSFCA
jgi:predicted nuclease of predicted toxin-antitoxin system